VNKNVKDIKPCTPISCLKREEFLGYPGKFAQAIVSDAVGMSKNFIRQVVGHSNSLNAQDVLNLLEQDAFSETFVPRSKVLSYLIRRNASELEQVEAESLTLGDMTLLKGNALNLIQHLPQRSVHCVITSTPYWAMRLYDEMEPVVWADGEICPFGMEQTPEGFIRHSVEVLSLLKPAMAQDGSVWWNIMDTFNTRTQIRSNSVEALHAMQGKTKTGWTEYDCRRYSAGHSYLKDGEQCLIPMKIAERASRIGYYLKTFISWTKTSTLPEPQNSRVSRNVEYIIHLSLQRTPRFYKEAYRALPAKLGGKNGILESDKLSDFWHLPTSTGRDGHGAQFPLALPGRCIALTTKEGDLVVDPFVGAGTSAIAAQMLERRFVGFDISEKYLATARMRLLKLEKPQFIKSEIPQLHEDVQGTLLPCLD